MKPKKAIKFPLKMKNGVEVRSLEELRENADLESIMQYYFSGQLTRWCKAFGMTDLPEQFECDNRKFVESVLMTLGLNGNIQESDIIRYVNENFGDNTSYDKVTDVEEFSLSDDKTIKEKLSSMLDNNINLDDYSIEVVPIKDDKGNIQKYRVCISNEKNDQYSRFSVVYELDDNYTHELFEKDLYRKIMNALEVSENTLKFNCTKIGTFSLLKVGDTFDFGRFNDKKIKWKVLRKDSVSLYAITIENLKISRFDISSNNWMNSEIRKWLNSDFYNSSFTADEKEKILTVNSDKVTLLSKEEAEQLMTQQERSIGFWWWLRTPFPGASYGEWEVYENGDFHGTHVSAAECGVRPAISLKI
ncbi:DUF6273 domain-containing protein [Ruminococcus sp. HUN007]|uniref:DUF6273 domain-containing protein n=1 Tax=Ruminococcus sp. HUN007 TaxID=1514668 RepID=UPI0005D157F6|nr:DUF6273 domain-containing protein [Ruminococcus sp. HUN007]